MLFPSSGHDDIAPELPTDLDSAVLLFSKTASFRHKDGIAGGVVALNEIAQQLERDIFATENGAVFNEQDLRRFDVVVFLNATGDMLSESQEAAFRAWLEAGGGWLGVHAAGDGSHAGWPWYVQNLLGAEFTAHILGPQFQTATVVIESDQHPINRASPAIGKLKKSGTHGNRAHARVVFTSSRLWMRAPIHRCGICSGASLIYRWAIIRSLGRTA